MNKLDKDFHKNYNRLVSALRALRDRHNMDPRRIASQAVITLKDVKPLKKKA